MSKSANHIEVTINNLWKEMVEALEKETKPYRRIYRRLELENEMGIRLGCVSSGSILELLIEMGGNRESVSFDFPKWKGMTFELIILDIPKTGTYHLRLFLEQQENRDIFIIVCTDLIRALNDCAIVESRTKEIEYFLARWTSFFERYGTGGLSFEQQRGLYGELYWLQRMIDGAVDASIAVHAWKGCNRDYHDYEINGRVVEVKTTMTKEPRRVQINNERQLDDRGLKSLHLYVLTIAKLEGEGVTLPDLIEILRRHLSGKAVLNIFNDALREAGYLDIHAHLYGSHYSILKEEFFHVSQGFPRITDMPPGVGNIEYTLTLAACTPHLTMLDDYMKDIEG